MFVSDTHFNDFDEKHNIENFELIKLINSHEHPDLVTFVGDNVTSSSNRSDGSIKSI